MRKSDFITMAALSATMGLGMESDFVPRRRWEPKERREIMRLRRRKRREKRRRRRGRGIESDRK